MKTKPIGIFDSGLGGLTVYREIRRILPGEDIIYFGDTMRVPYGGKSVESIKLFAQQITDFLLSFNVKLIVVACNTVSANAIDVVEEKFFGRVIGVIEPGVRFAVSMTKSKKILVIGTRATVNSHSYKKMIKMIDRTIDVNEVACPLFVPLVEEGFNKGIIAKMIVERYLGRYSKSDYDTLILGCTHYPLLKSVIKKVLPNINVIDSSKVCALSVKKFLSEKGLVNPKRFGESIFYVSDRPQNFVELSYRLAGIKICKIKIKRF